MTKRLRKWVRAGLAVPVLLAFSCTPNLPNEPSEAVVMAVFDPATSRLPSPNNLALADGRVAIAHNALLSDAENELKQSFNGRDGFSMASTAKVSFTGALHPESIKPGAVFGLDLGPAGQGPDEVLALNVEYSPCDVSLNLTPQGGFKPGHIYVFAARGGVDGLQGSGREAVAPSPAFHFLRAGRDLREHPNAFPGTRAEREATAGRLEALRQVFEPYFVKLEGHGLPRQEIVALWHFSVQAQTEAAFDAASKRLPLPNDLLRDPVTGRVTLPANPADSPEAAALKQGLSQLDGFSLTGTFTVEATAPLSKSSLVPGKTVRLFQLSPLKEVESFTADVGVQAHQLIITPTAPLQSATTYAVIVAGVTDELGVPLTAMPLASLLKLKSPLVQAEKDGQNEASTLSSVCLETARKLEPFRASLAPTLDFLESAGVPRVSVAAAFTFTTQNIEKRLEALYQAPYVADLPLELTDIESKNPLQWYAPLALPLNSVARIIKGKLTTLDYLDPVTRSFRADGTGQPRKIEFVLTMPKNLPEGGTFPVVVFGHGLMTERRLGLTIADTLAEKGFGVLSIDFPYHGERTACLKDEHCETGAKCLPEGTCRLTSGEPADFDRRDDFPFFQQQLNISIPWPLGKGIPTASGEAFIDVANLFGSRDHFRQALVDLSAVTRLLRLADWSKATGGYHVDKAKQYYVGISLGSILGSNAMAMDPGYKAALLSVGGAGLPEIMRDSDLFGPRLRQGLAAKGINPGTEAHFRFVNAAHWVMDEMDPVNLGRFVNLQQRAYQDPITYEAKVLPRKKLRLHMAINDNVIPNSATERLAKALGINRDTEFEDFTSQHGGLALNPLEKSDMAAFLEANR